MIKGLRDSNIGKALISHSQQIYVHVCVYKLDSPSLCPKILRGGVLVSAPTTRLAKRQLAVCIKNNSLTLRFLALAVVCVSGDDRDPIIEVSPSYFLEPPR